MGYLTMALGEQAMNVRSYHVCAFTVRPAGETCAFSERWNGRVTLATEMDVFRTCCCLLSQAFELRADDPRQLTAFSSAGRCVMDLATNHE
jgi:hypothetical protein